VKKASAHKSYWEKNSTKANSHLPQLHHVQLADAAVGVADVTASPEVLPQLGHGLVAGPLVGAAQHPAEFDLGRVEIELGIEQILGRGLLALGLGRGGGLVETGVEQVRLGAGGRRLEVGLLLPRVGRVGTLHAALPLGHLLLGAGGHVLMLE